MMMMMMMMMTMMMMISVSNDDSVEQVAYFEAWNQRKGLFLSTITTRKLSSIDGRGHTDRISNWDPNLNPFDLAFEVLQFS